MSKHVVCAHLHLPLFSSSAAQSSDTRGAPSGSAAIVDATTAGTATVGGIVLALVVGTLALVDGTAVGVGVDGFSTAHAASTRSSDAKRRLF
jgi:hypothetical protein